MNIFFDLDGTLIDARPRLYQLFQFLVPDSQLSFDEYWELKRNKNNHKKILTFKFNYSEEQYIEFETSWMEEIEKKKWLDLDVPFPGVEDTLYKLSKKNKLFVATARQSESSALEQIRLFGWQNLFSKILITSQKLEKYDLIKNNLQTASEDWFVGDTGKDIQTGKQLGIKTAAVLSGFLNRQSLLPYHPDVIEDNITNINFEL